MNVGNATWFPRHLRSGRVEVSLRDGDYKRLVNQGGHAFYESEFWADTTGAMEADSIDLEKFIKAKREAKRAAYKLAMSITGKVMSEARWREQQKRQSQIEVMDEDIAQKMERCVPGGGYSRSPSAQRGAQIYHVGIYSKKVLGRKAFRRNKFIPSVAHEKRGEILRELTYFVENAEGHCRHWVFHDGPRCLIHDLKDRWREQNRRCNRFNESALARNHGVEIVFRSNEAGSPLKKEHGKTWNADTQRMERRFVRDAQGNRLRNVDEKGRQTYHPHTHIVVHFKRWMDKEQFTAFIVKAQKFFGVPFLDHGRLAEPREACKYVVKLDELRELREAGEHEDFREFFDGTRLAHLVATAGGLRQQVRFHKRHQIRLRMQTDVLNGVETCKYVPMENWNQTEFTLQETDGERIARRCRSIRPGDDYVQLLAVTQPMAFGSVVYEPVAVVRGVRVSYEKVMNIKQVRELHAQHEADWRAGADGVWLETGTDPVEAAEKITNGDAAQFLPTIPPYLPGVGPLGGSGKPPERSDGAFRGGGAPAGAIIRAFESPNLPAAPALTREIAERRGPRMEESWQRIEDDLIYALHHDRKIFEQLCARFSVGQAERSRILTLPNPFVRKVESPVAVATGPSVGGSLTDNPW